MTQLLRVQNFLVSADGFGAGEGQSLERPFGHANPADLGAWAFETASWPNRSEPGGTRGLDDYFTRDYARNIGAEIMGRNKFGPQRGPWEDLALLGDALLGRQRRREAGLRMRRLRSCGGGRDGRQEGAGQHQGADASHALGFRTRGLDASVNRDERGHEQG